MPARRSSHGSPTSRVWAEPSISLKRRNAPGGRGPHLPTRIGVRREGPGEEGDGKGFQSGHYRSGTWVDIAEESIYHHRELANELPIVIPGSVANFAGIGRPCPYLQTTCRMRPGTSWRCAYAWRVRGVRGCCLRPDDEGASLPTYGTAGLGS